jgi:hypothetical protein
MSGSIRSFAVACTAIVAAAGLAGEAGSGAYPLAPVRLSTAGADVEASRPHVALDARGDALAVWTESVHSGMTTMAAIRPPGGSWPAAVPLAAGGYAQLAVNRRGDAVVAGLLFGKTTRIFAVYRRTGRRFGPARRISGPVAGPGTGSVSVAISSAGRALVAWSDGTKVRVAASDSGGRWSQRVLGAGGDPAAAMDRKGDALVLWHVPAGADGGFAGAWQPHGRPWKPAQTLSAPDRLLSPPGAPQLALDDAGDAVAVFPVWSRSTPQGTYLEAADARLGRAFSAPRRIGAGFDGVSAQLAVAPDGRATVVYVDGRSDGSVWATGRKGARRRFSKPVELEAQDSLEPAVALAGAGPLALWTQSTGSPILPQQLELFGAVGRPDDSFASPAELGPIGSDCWMHRCLHGGAASVALAPDGHGFVAWVQKQDPNSSVGGTVVAANVSRVRE